MLPGMVMRKACHLCRQEIALLDCFDGQRRAFALIKATDPNTPQAERWLVRNSDGLAVHGGVVRTSITGEWLVRHRCRAARREALPSIADVLHSKRSVPQQHPQVDDLPPLDDSHEWAYQWFIGIRHILSLGRGRSMCGQRVERYDVRDQERMRQMKACDVCVYRWEAWRAVKASHDQRPAAPERDTPR